MDGKPENLNDKITCCIDLDPMLKQEEHLKKYVTFDGIKEDSCLRCHELELHQRLKQKNKYKPRVLLDLTVSNTSYIFDIGAQYEKKLEK